MTSTEWVCRKCLIPLMYYNIGFDDGYQCQQCKRILSYHELSAQADKALPSPDAEPLSRTARE
jgi:hypothetical protein